MKRKNDLLIGILIFTTSFQIVRSLTLVCPTGWSKLYEKCYHVFPTKTTWAEALENCRRYGGKLAEPRGYTVNDNINYIVSRYNQNINSQPLNSIIQYSWIGYNRRNYTGNDAAIGYWSDDVVTSVEVGDWANFEPLVTNGDCVAINNNNNGLWYMKSCDSLFPSICELTPCPEGTFRCSNGRVCLGQQKVCNGEDDCGDFSDERDCSNYCTRYLYDETGQEQTITYPSGNVNYPASATCLWVLEGPPGSFIQVQVLQFQSEENIDVLEFWEGEQTWSDGRCLAKISGDLTEDYNVIVSTNNFLTVRFISDYSVQGRGFSLKWRTSFKCQLTKLENRRMIITDTVQYANCYTACLNDAGCSGYMLNKIDNSCYKVTDFTQPTEDGCCDLYVKTCPGTTGFPELPTMPNQGGIIQAGSTDQQIFTTFYPSNYPAGQIVTWLIQTTGRNIVTLQVLDIELCDSDRILIKDGDSLFSDTIATLTSSTVAGDVIMSTRNGMYIVMELHQHLSCRGVLFSIREACHFTMTANSGILFSPGFGVKNYTEVIRCTWHIATESRRRMRFYFEYFDLNNGDFVQVYIGDNEQGTAVYAHDGLTGYQVNPSVIVAPEGRLFVVFESQTTNTHVGFKANYSSACANFSSSLTVTRGSANTFWPSIVTLNCANSGFYLQEPYTGHNFVTLQCMPNGQYDMTIPQCDQAYCPSYPTVENSYIASGDGLRGGQSVKYGCLAGYASSGSLTLNCNSDGSWDDPPTCTGAVCTEQSSSLPGGVRTIVTGNGTSHGTVLRYRCNDNYELTGISTIACENGQWSNNPPSCTRVKCSVPHIDNGVLNRGAPLFQGDTLRVTCASGYFLSGTSPFLCGVDATPTCNDTNECSDTSICQCPPGVSDCTNGNCVDNDGSYSCTCPSGYQYSSNYCQDISECSSSNALCYHTCTDSAGSYACSCSTGYRLYTYGFQQMYPNFGQTGNQPWNDLYIGHSCVRVQCPSPVLRAHQQALGVISASLYYYTDRLTITCGIGYLVQGRSSATFDIECLYNGSWSFVYSCEAATCARNPAYPSAVVPSDIGIGYGQRYNLTCTLPDGSIAYRYQVCSYDVVSKTYQLRGDDMTCPVINCRAPGFITGSSYSYGCTTFNCSFTFACQTGYRLAGASSKGDQIVRCGTDGRWDFAYLTCIGGSCDEPGSPPDGYRVNPAIASYAEGTMATFACSRTGYTPDPPYPVNCTVCAQDNVLVWNASRPSCIDTQAPTFSFCTTTDYNVTRFEAPMFTVPVATDNSGLVSAFVVSTTNSKQNFQPSQVVYEEFTVAYTAVDSVGNSRICRIDIHIRDEIPPNLQCRNSDQYTIINENYQIVLNVTNTYVQAVETGATLIASPGAILINKDLIGTVQRATIAAFDSSGNSAVCNIQVYTQAPLCQDWTLQVANANKNCMEKSNGGYNCSFTCNTGYKFFEDLNLQSVNYECDPPTQWTRVPVLGVAEDTYRNLPQCRPFSRADYRQQFILRYQVTALTQLAVQCGVLYQNNINQQWNTLMSSLQTLCRNGSAYSYVVTEPSNSNLDNLELTISETSSTVYVFVSYHLEIQLSNEIDSAFTSCATKIKAAFEGMTGAVSAINSLPLSSSGGFNCPSSSQVTFIRANIDGLVCDKYGGCEKLQKSTSDDRTYCMECPSSGTTGHYKFNATTWPKCPAGTYRSPSDYTSCSNCPLGTNSTLDGLATENDCYLSCPPGMTSASGRAPCTECGRNSYSSNPFSCTTCPVNTLTRETGRTSSSDCKVRCSPGYFSYDGHEPCRACPRNYYQQSEGATTCLQCSSSQVTERAASNSSNYCIQGDTVLCSAGRCSNGGTCTVIEHDFYCQCPPGYTGRFCQQSFSACDSSPCYNSGICTPTAPGGNAYTCSCIGGSQYDPLADCEDTSGTVRTLDDCTSENLCQKDPACVFTEGATTVCNSYGQIRRKCSCKYGFTGDRCETNIDECLSSPCHNGGTCNDGDNSFSCTCEPGFTGAFCESWDPAGACSGNCGSAACTDYYVNGTYRCLCPNDQLYANGSCSSVNHCASDPCKNGGSCTNKYGGYFCTCKPGNAGQQCLTFIDECSSSPCQNGGTCFDGDNDYRCGCPAGTTGKNCDDIADDCVPNPCDPDNTASACVELVNDYNCICKDGYYGKNCSEGDVNCNSFPCHHGATCVDNTNGYTCNCPAGWTGADCRTEIDQCSTLSPCQNGASCINIVDDYICQCANNYVGENCSIHYQPCNVADPCANNATCYVSDGLPQCQCQSGYQGAGCHVRTDSCSTTNCQNGASCIIENLQAVCNCLPGYTGTQCQTNIDECETGPCPANSLCIDGINSYTCQCNDGLIGQNCDKPLTHDFDFIIQSELGCGESDTITEDSVFVLGSDALSVSVWVRYTQNTDPGIVFSLYGLDQNLESATPVLLAQLSATTIQFIIGSSSGPISFLETINDGRWHHFVLTWNGRSPSGSGTTGRFIFYIDGAKITERTNFGSGEQLPYNGWVVFGGEYNISARKISKTDGMRGRLSRFFIMTSELSLSPDITALYRPEIVYVPNIVINKPVADMLENGRGVIDFRSELSAGKCLSSSSCIGIVDNPTASCPDDQMAITSRDEKPTWTAASFPGATSVTSNRVSGGEVLNWGVYGISYAGYDTNNNAAVCTFLLFNKRTACSTVKPDLPIDGSQSCVSVSGMERCEISCPTNMYHVTAEPRYYTCSKYGMYGVDERQEKYVYPACADSTHLTYDAEIRATYDLSPSVCNDALRDALTTRVRQSFATISGKWRGDGTGLCGTSCRQASVTVSCDQTNTKATVLASFPRVEDPLLATGNVNEQSTIYDAVMDEVGQGTLDYTANGQSLVRASVLVNLLPSCEDQFQVVGSLCVKCGQGHKYDSESKNCIPCPIGQYQDEVGKVVCKSCRQGFTTYQTGTQSADLCFVSCSVGKYYSFDSVPEGCRECPVGYYQPQRGAASCIACAPGLTTDGIGKNDISACVDPVSITTSTLPTATDEGEESKITGLTSGEIAAIILSIIIAVGLVLLFCCVCRDKLPCYKAEKVVPDDETPWKYVNKYGETDLTFVSYKLNDLRTKRGVKPLEKRPIVEKTPEYTYSAEETGSIKTDISVHVPIFKEVLGGKIKKKRTYTANSQVATDVNLNGPLPPSKGKRSKRKRKTKKRKTAKQATEPVEMVAPMDTQVPKPLPKIKHSPSDGSFNTSSTYLHSSGNHYEEMSNHYTPLPSHVPESRINIDSDEDDRR